MRRASASLLSRIACRSTPISTKASSRSYAREPCPLSHGHGLLYRPAAGFASNPSRNIDAIAERPEPTSQVPSRQRKVQEKSKLEEAFESAKTLDDMLGVFKMMESYFNEKELGMAALKIGLKLDQEGEDPEKIIDYAGRALRVLDGDGKPNLLLAMALHLMGSANYGLNRFNDSLGYLNRANKLLGRLEEEGSGSGSVGVEDLRPVRHAVLLELANVKTAMGRREEAIGNLRMCLELKEAMFEDGSVELGKPNRDLAEAYVAVLNFKDALPFSLKALEIHKNQLGNNSAEVAQDRRILGVIYTGLEEHEKALEQNELSRKILGNWGMRSDLIRAEIEAANIQIALGKHDKAIETLKAVVQKSEKDSETRAMVFISMAKALSEQDKAVDAKRCLEIACGILDKREQNSPSEVAEAYSEISMQYESMNEFEPAITLLKRALALLEKLPQEQHSEGSISARVGWLLLLTGKVHQAIPYLESAAETLEGCFGSKHFGIGYIYNNLGAAYLELDRPQSAAQMFAVAKDIMDVALGPHHVDTIDACQNLSKAYSAAGSYALAIEFQQQVVDAWEGHGSTAEDQLKEARQLLRQLKKNASGGSSSNELSKKPIPLPHG